ncbi:MAG: hypothetical protein HZB51_29470 [Chloroflexi bacterium]|nr:hypothetical protein [Chloroflexota bacterium]
METRNGLRNGAMGGIVLILIGLMMFVAQLTQSSSIALFILPALGLIFLAWGISTRNAGPMIPGGILSGLGMGVLIVNGTLGQVDEMISGSIVLLSIALGFFVITPLTTCFSGKTQWWALIPAAILGFIGTALLAGNIGLQLITLLGYVWPLVLIAVGGYIIFKRQSAHA